MNVRQSVLIAVVVGVLLLGALGCTRVLDPPIASFAIHGLSGGTCVIGSELTFDGSDTGCPAGESIVQYEWDFGDGQEAHGREVRHCFAGTQTYDVRLRVTDSRGGTDTITRTVTVLGHPCPSDPASALDPIIKLELTSTKFGLCTIEEEAGQALPVEKCDTLAIRVIARDPDNRTDAGITYCSAEVISPSGKRLTFSTNADDGSLLDLANPIFHFSLTELGVWMLIIEVRDDERSPCQGITRFVQEFQSTFCSECNVM